MKDISFDIPDADERGVSPVIGVILMVAITVILAAVIASFVLGFGGDLSEPAQAGVNIDSVEDTENGTITVTWIQQGNAKELEVRAQNTNNNSLTDDFVLENVSDTKTFYESDLNETGTNSTQITVTVTAVTEGDSRTVIRTKTVTV